MKHGHTAARPAKSHKEKGQGVLINVYKYLIIWCTRGRAKLFSVVPRQRTRDNGHKVKYKEFHLNLWKPIYSVWVSEHRSRLPREIVEFPSLGIFKTWLDMALSNLLYLCSCFEQEELDKTKSRGVFQLQLFCDSVTLESKLKTKKDHIWPNLAKQ